MSSRSREAASFNLVEKVPEEPDADSTPDLEQAFFARAPEIALLPRGIESSTRGRAGTPGSPSGPGLQSQAAQC